MASTIKVTVSRTRSAGRREITHTLSESFTCADSSPSSGVLKDCLRQVTRKFRLIHGEGSVETDMQVK
jgi:hypothetical protein